jgi:general secretion pathway protein D
LFKYQSGSHEKTNLMIFLRPTVIRNQEQSGTIVADRYDYMRQSQIKAETPRPLFRDLGSAVVPTLQEGGAFMNVPRLRLSDELSKSLPTNATDVDAAP